MGGRGLALAALQAALEQRRHVQDVGAAARGGLVRFGRGFHLAGGHALVDVGAQLRAVVVMPVLRSPRPAHGLDQLLGHLAFARVDLGCLEGARRQAEVFHAVQFLVVAQQVQQQHVAFRNERGEVRAGAYHHRGDAHAPAFFQRIAQQRVAFFALGLAVRHQVIGLVEPLGADGVLRHEALDVRAVGRLRRGALEVLVTEHHVVAGVVLEGAHDLVPRHLGAGFLVHALVAHAGVVARIEHAKLQLAAVLRRVQHHRDADQPEGDVTAPDRTRHCRAFSDGATRE